MKQSIMRMKRKPSVMKGTPKEGDCAGVRPSSGAAASDPHSTLESSATSLFVDMTAPEGGRTPLEQISLATSIKRTKVWKTGTSTSGRSE